MATSLPISSIVVLLASHVLGLQLDTAILSNAIWDITNTSLGVPKMQDLFNSLEYSSVDRDPAERVLALSQRISLTFDTQKKALERLKTAIEDIYMNRDFVDQSTVVECCNADGLHQSYQFVVNISEERSCDRISPAADDSAESLYGKLDSVYMKNNIAPLKWQYFGSENGVANQFPSARASSCDDYDPRFRPWYIASATPHPKDVVLLVKNNLFPQDSVRARQYEAADIILRTLNPKDKVAVFLYNKKITKPASDGCYVNNLAIATPANIEKFHYFLNTRPEPESGHDLLSALDTAFQYFDWDSASNTSRDKAILLFTDGERINSPDERVMITDFVSEHSQGKIKVFVFTAVKDLIESSVREFYIEMITAASDEKQNQNQFYIELPAAGDLRKVLTVFYQRFASLNDAATNDEFNPVFQTPYYDLFGLAQLVLTLAVPCYMNDPTGRVLVGVAAVDLTVSDLLASVEYFSDGVLSYAFIIDKEGLTLFHPNLPVPSTNYTFVYLDIATLETHDGFTDIRHSMINGESGCMIINSTHILSRGNSLHDGSTAYVTPASYCWRPVNGTTFSLCVVIPVNSTQRNLYQTTFQTPSSDLYHRIDVPDIKGNLDLCRHLNHNATEEFSTVKFSPESFSYPERYLANNETEEDANYLQNVITSLVDHKQVLRSGVVDSVAITLQANSHWKSFHRNDAIVWRYIATSDGVLRVYPGIKVTPKFINPLQRPWYQRAVAHLGTIVVSTPYNDSLRAEPVITISQALLSQGCDSNTDYQTDPDCSVVAVMALDLTKIYFWKLLIQTIPQCTESDLYRCMIIDNTGYLVTHPLLNEDYKFDSYVHLTELEPFVSQDMLSLGYFKHIYCNNFQYNYNFTILPRRQYSYEVSEMVYESLETLSGGYSRFCIFYKIAPVVNTNIFVIAVEVERSQQSRCFPITCECNPDSSCSSGPADCVCPCTENIPPENYNPCGETFSHLSAPPCPVRFGMSSVSSISVTIPPVDETLPFCFSTNCNGSSQIECEVVAGCRYCPVINTTTGSCAVLSEYSCSDDILVQPSTTVLVTPDSASSVSSVKWIVSITLMGVVILLMAAAIIVILIVMVFLRRHTKTRFSVANRCFDEDVELKNKSLERKVPTVRGVQVLDSPLCNDQNNLFAKVTQQVSVQSHSTSSGRESHGYPHSSLTTYSSIYGNSFDDATLGKLNSVRESKESVEDLSLASKNDYSSITDELGDLNEMGVVNAHQTKPISRTDNFPEGQVVGSVEVSIAGGIWF